MTIVIAIDVPLAQREMTAPGNDRAKAVQLTTLEALRRELKCQPGDSLEYDPAPTD